MKPFIYIGVEIGAGQCAGWFGIDRHYKWYNEKRRHGSLNRQVTEPERKKYNPILFENEKVPNYL